MTNKHFFGMTLVTVLLAVVLTFQITYITQELKHQRELDEFTGQYESEFLEFTSWLSKYSKLAEIDSVFRSRYIGEIDDEALIDGMMIGYIYGSGDKYANYFTKEEFAEMIADTEGDLVGIGVLVIETDGLIEIINVMPDSPALEAGVEPGDLIYTVGDEYVSEIGYQIAVNRMLGDAGTVIEFSVLRDGEEIDFYIERDHVNEQTVMSRHMSTDPTVGIIKILSFDNKTPAQFIEACNTLLDGGAERLVFDVRYNPGGELTSICEVLDYLLPEGPIVRIVDGAGTEQVISSDAEALDVPMCVLVNRSTASAAELFASALQDYKKAELVGTTTYGKGTVQGVMRLSDGSGFTVSHSMYYPPYSDCYEGIGVIPDVICEMDEGLADKNIYKITDEEDTQLNRAVEVLNNVDIAA